ncbi:MAG TPA: class I SAM-dependent methyltransferase [Kofleriaceae bacterium]|jgi:predicted O-methyltransferase YrrM
MTTFEAITPLLDRLFADAETSDAALRARFASTPPAEIQAVMRSGDYRAMYTRLAGNYLAVSRETGALLYLLARTSRARHVVEFGTSFGISTLHLAAAVRDNGGGRVVGSEFAATKVAQARANLAEGGLADLVEIRDGDALETLATNLPSPIDLVLFDGAKPLYARILALVEPHLRPGALLVSDNVDDAPDYLARVRGPGFVSVPFADDVEVSMKL